MRNSLPPFPEHHLVFCVKAQKYLQIKTLILNQNGKITLKKDVAVFTTDKANATRFIDWVPELVLLHLRGIYRSYQIDTDQHQLVALEPEPTKKWDFKQRTMLDAISELFALP